MSPEIGGCIALYINPKKVDNKIGFFNRLKNINLANFLKQTAPPPAPRNPFPNSSRTKLGILKMDTCIPTTTNVILPKSIAEVACG